MPFRALCITAEYNFPRSVMGACSRFEQTRTPGKDEGMRVWEELTTTATMKMAAARTPAAKYALCNSMGLLSTTDEPKVLSLKFLAFASSTINSLELTTVSTTNSSAERPERNRRKKLDSRRGRHIFYGPR